MDNHYVVRSPRPARLFSFKLLDGLLVHCIGPLARSPGGLLSRTPSAACMNNPREHIEITLLQLWAQLQSERAAGFPCPLIRLPSG